jgi:hypothetical protein
MSERLLCMVDTDLGHGSDAIQSYIGLNFDLSKLFSKPAADKAVGFKEKQ